MTLPVPQGLQAGSLVGSLVVGRGPGREQLDLGSIPPPTTVTSINLRSIPGKWGVGRADKIPE